MMLLEYLQIAFQNLVDILKIYLKFAILTLCLYLIAEWYIVRFGIDLDDEQASLVPAQFGQNSTLHKVYRFAVDFLFK